ncbi:MAG: hypothetical protein ACOX7P_02595 [Oscillospiraceae bacterium]|jgi:uncharacterized membrane protein (DUF373 family)
MKLFGNQPAVKEKAFGRIYYIIQGVEIVLSCILIVFVLVSVGYMVAGFAKDAANMVGYDNLQSLLSYLLLLIIAVELAVMLIGHNPASVLEVMIYAIARKMLIFNTSAVDMLLSVIAIGILFFIRSYLYGGIFPKFKKEKPEPDERNQD